MSQMECDADEIEKKLKWSQLETLPTHDRLRTGLLKRVGKDGEEIGYEMVDVTKLSQEDKKLLMTSIVKAVDKDNDSFLRRCRHRLDRVGIEIPKVEVRFEHLSVQGDTYVGSRALPTLPNSILNALEAILGFVRLSKSKKQVNKILFDLSGILRPSKITLLLGPPGSGKTTLWKALSGMLDKELKVTGKVTYCGHELSEIIPQRTSAYISHHDLHSSEMTVRETLDFSGRCMGVGSRFDVLLELSRREKEAGVIPDFDIDAFMKATGVAGKRTSLLTDYILKMLGLDVCENIKVGNEMIRGISGGEKKRLTTGEMLVGPTKVFFMDEISTGLDSSTTFQVAKYLKQMVHIFDVTMMISLLQPAPETFELFDDIILLSEGQIIYHGPRDKILKFFEHMGFKCPERKGVADFLQEVTSSKDQEQYWFSKNQPYRYVLVDQFVESFHSYQLGRQLSEDLTVPYDKRKVHPAALVTEKYGLSKWELFKACFSREVLLMKRNSFIYVFKITQITVMSLLCLTVFIKKEMKHGHIEDGGRFYGALLFGLINVMFNGMAELAMIALRLPVFFKQRDMLLYPGWAVGLPLWLLGIPQSVVESGIWVVLSYFSIGFAPDAVRCFRQFLAYFCVHQMSMSLFRLISIAGRTEVIANMLATFVMTTLFVLGGFIISKDDLGPWMKWSYFVSPLMYGQNAVAINEFLDKRWSTPIIDPTQPNNPQITVGKFLLRSKGMFTEEYWYWICIAALLGFSLLFNVCFITALAYLNPWGDSKSSMKDEHTTAERGNKLNSSPHEAECRPNDPIFEGIEIGVRKDAQRGCSSGVVDHTPIKGMVLPFKPLSLVFNHVNYSVDMPAEIRSQGIKESRLQLLRDVSGAFRPGVLTALVGISGAGKTTLMDVLAGRKTGGYIEGNINVSGYPKNQTTFARVIGYCEQNDIHSPRVTVYESLLYSAWLRLPRDVYNEARKMFVEEVMDLVELKSLRNALVGLPGVDGLSTEQRKRLTIAVELVSNPSIIFMDEPTSGLDARAAAIVMRTVRNTVDTGRTVVCTIHQPSIDIFEAFDELLLMKRGGQVIYSGPIGHHSDELIQYFEAIPEVPKIREGYNPATWVLEVTGYSVEVELDIDFAEAYARSGLYQKNQDLIEELSTRSPGSQDIYFPSKYSQSFTVQFIACFWKQHWSYWRNSQYNGIRFIVTILTGLMFGVIFWNKGEQTSTQQDIQRLMGAMYSAILFLGATNAIAVQPIVAIERTVFYRERAVKMYSELPYAFAQVAIETVYLAIQTLVYSILFYSMMGFHWQVGKFLWFYYFMFTSFLYIVMFGMMMVALTPLPQLATICTATFLTIWNLFGGFLIPRMQLPIWCRWYYWANPFAWTLYGVVTCLVGDKNTPVQITGQANEMMLKRFLKEFLGFEHEFLGYVALAHLGFVLLFFFIFAYGIKFLNFQKR
ncbi:pleiotropic drug resistance protein 2-like isoform X1 [Papaver somniferum]|uniref:pleiotropic drug resistance protein 2-like isoform X1 n=2 Tax=Papaver somniferum TaxID=3469 RepID=UPI000E7009D1|nr:pleiotropic drug resistance protein 2-like isoform X1 [Papaver somniferum]XP_026403552.1 pleiotropic drug resistance protein 2-like isoform X1 [Papaver somniferum]